MRYPLGRFFTCQSVLLFAALLASMASASLAAAESDAVSERNLVQALYGDLAHVKYFYTINASVTESAKAIGVSESELSDFVKLKFKNLFTGFESKPLPRTQDGRDYDHIDRTEWAFLSVYLTTVGDSYPVAYNIELIICRFGGRSQEYRDSILGYTTQLMERAAIAMLRLQDKL